MRKFLSTAILFLFILGITLPVEAYAQYGGGFSSSIRRKIRSLSTRKVENVPVPILFGITPDNISSDFGDPRGGGTRRHEGQDILAPRGAPIVSPTDAVVIRVGNGDSSGYYVYTANPGREVFVYMHLNEESELNEGEELEKGELIGYIGNTGNASGGVTHLHFEIHDDDGDPIDPFPRLTRIFPLADKIKYLAEILDNADDEKELAELMVAMYRRELILAPALGILLPERITTALQTVPLGFVPVSTVTSSGDLKFGSQGSAVSALQSFLLTKNAGVNNGVVVNGVFDLATQKALATYQAGAGISPATGYYGPITQAYIAAHP